MASVWCAEDELLGRTVAVKVLAERFAHEEVAVRRFKREARTAARVSGHPHVVTIFDVGGDIEPREDERQGGHEPAIRAFMVMEFLSGGTVADAIRVGAVDREDALRWLDEAASALDHAHLRGIVHRDIKPANFLLDNARVLHVADFGIARLVSDETITNSGELFGTAAYLSPEQAVGEEVTSASDRYSLAVAAFELLAGQRPFPATNFAAQARQHVEDEVPRASEIDPSLPPSVDSILTRGMAKRPGERYRSAGAFVAALEAALEEEPAAAAATATTTATETLPLVASAAEPVAHTAQGQIPSPIVPGTLPPRRHGRVFALAALAVVIAGVIALTAFGHGGSGSPAASIASHTTTHQKAAARTPTHRRSRPKAAAHSSSATGTNTSSSAATAPGTATAPTSAPPAGSADSLEAQGHQELSDGNYGGAISTLNQALHSADHSSLTYAYALYDLGRALMLSGNPQAAIPVLEQRLQIPNQTPVVQQTLNQARQQAGQPAPSTGGATTPSTGGATTPSATTPSPTTPSHSPPPPPGHAHGHAPQGPGRGHHSDNGGSGGAGISGD